MEVGGLRVEEVAKVIGSLVTSTACCNIKILTATVVISPTFSSNAATRLSASSAAT
jgi:hypothetical protein